MRRVSYPEFRSSLLTKSRRIPIDTYLEVTYRCNFRCKQCYNPLNRAQGRELSASEIKRFIDLLVDNGCLWLNFTGGEPFIREDFFEFYTYALSKGLICCIQSNGSLITQDLAARLAEYPPYSLDITVYGASPETYAAVTGQSQGFKQCEEGIHNLLSAGIRPFLKTTVTKDNKDDVPAIKEIAGRYGLNYSYDAHIHPRVDGDKSPQQLRLSPAEVAELSLFDPQRHNDWKRYIESYIDQPNPQELVACGALEDGFWIDPYGKLRICAIVPKPTYDLRNGGNLEQAWDMFYGYIQSQKPREGNPCLTCRLFSFCGHCIGWSELEHNDWNCKVDYLCEIAHAQEIKLKELGLWPKELNCNARTL